MRSATAVSVQIIKWIGLNNPNVALVVVYAYHANAQTLYDAHLKPKPQAQPQFHSRFHNPLQNHVPSAIPERTLWSYIIQIASAIKRVHEAGLAVRMIDASKILVTGQNRCVSHLRLLCVMLKDVIRIRISSCGIVDVLMHGVPQQLQDIHVLQQEDLTMFGRLLFALCCSSVMATSGTNFQKSLDVMGRLYSPDVKNVALFLINKGGPHRVRAFCFLVLSIS